MDKCSFCLKTQNNLQCVDDKLIDLFKIFNEIHLQIKNTNKICQTCKNNLYISYNFYNQCLSTFNHNNEIYSKEEKIALKTSRKKETTKKSEKRTYNCLHCSDQFQSFASLKKHESIHKIPEQCDYCRQVFPSKYDADNHIETDHPKKRYSCKFCPETFYNKLFYLVGHLSSVHKVKSPYGFCFECEESTDNCPTIEELLFHVRKEHSLKLDDDLNLKMHEEFLDEYFLNDFNMWDDMNFCIDFDFSKLNSHESSGAKRVSRYNCPVCEEGFDHQKDLYIHSAEIHDKFILLCRKCGKKYNRLKLLQLHKLSHKKESALKTTNCNFCGKNFTSRKGLEYHCEIEHLYLEYECLYCSKCFSSSINLNKHLNQKHSSFKMHICSLCESEFATLDHLKKHVESGHQKVKNFLCSKCGKTFSQLCHLKDHNVNCSKMD